MGQLTQPQTFLVGSTQLEQEGLRSYLEATGNEAFWNDVNEARELKVSGGEVLCSTAAKVCYKSLTEGKNANVTKSRNIIGNLQGCIANGHSSVWGHCVLNFITTNCSRLFTHELIRHEVGTEVDVPPLPVGGLGLHEWSQTSGRFVRLDRIDVAWDPILKGCEGLALAHVKATEDLVYLLECKKGLRRPPGAGPSCTPEQTLALRDDPGEGQLAFEKAKWAPNDDLPFDTKKKLTSAIRRFAFNGQVNEVFWSANIRALRHMLQMRTNRGAEWEIRLVFGQVFDIVKDKFPIAFGDAKVEIVEGLKEVTGLKTQPYAPTPLSEVKDADLLAELKKRGFFVVGD